MRGVARLVTGELNHPALASAALLDRPVYHLCADPLTAQGTRDSHRLDLRTPCAAKGDAWDEGQLHRTDNRAALLGDDLALVGVGIDEVEGAFISGNERKRGILALLAQRVLGKQRDDSGEIGEGWRRERW